MSGPLKFWSILILVFAGLIWAASRFGGGLPAAEESGEAREMHRSIETAASSHRDSAPLSSSEDAGPAEWVDEKETLIRPSGGTGAAASLGVAGVAAEIGRRAPAVVVLFSTECPRSRRLFPEFARLAENLSGDTSVLAYSTLGSDAKRLPEFLAASGAMFEAGVIEAWQPGELTAAMAGVGLHLGSTWSLPFVAVMGEGGAVLGEWQGVSQLGEIEQALRSGGMLR